MRLQDGTLGLELEQWAASVYYGVIDTLAALAAHDNRLELEDGTPEYLVEVGLAPVVVEK